ncbi:MAG: hypothetical protein ACR2N3_17200 [Pyrinomonadaceae bacterium]
MRIDKTKIVFQVADFIGAVFSALNLGVVFMAGGVSGGCRSLSDGTNYEIAFILLSILSYIFAFIFVWKIYDKVLNPFFLGILSWLFISVIGLFTASIFWGILESLQCSENILNGISESFLGAGRISVSFIPIMFVTFVIGLTVNLDIKFNSESGY